MLKAIQSTKHYRAHLSQTRKCPSRHISTGAGLPRVVAENFIREQKIGLFGQFTKICRWIDHWVSYSIETTKNPQEQNAGIEAAKKYALDCLDSTQHPKSHAVPDASNKDWFLLEFSNNICLQQKKDSIAFATLDEIQSLDLRNIAITRYIEVMAERGHYGNAIHCINNHLNACIAYKSLAASVCAKAAIKAGRLEQAAEFIAMIQFDENVDQLNLINTAALAGHFSLANNLLSEKTATWRTFYGLGLYALSQKRESFAATYFLNTDLPVDDLKKRPSVIVINAYNLFEEGEIAESFKLVKDNLTRGPNIMFSGLHKMATFLAKNDKLDLFEKELFPFVESLAAECVEKNIRLPDIINENESLAEVLPLFILESYAEQLADSGKIKELSAFVQKYGVQFEGLFLFAALLSAKHNNIGDVYKFIAMARLSMKAKVILRSPEFGSKLILELLRHGNIDTAEYCIEEYRMHIELTDEIHYNYLKKSNL